MITGANTNAIIAVFTAVIAGTTVAYTLVTWRLLRQSRWAFLVDSLIRITQDLDGLERRHLDQKFKELSGRMERMELKDDIMRRWEELRLKVQATPYSAGLAEAIENVSGKLALDLYKPFIVYIKRSSKVKEELGIELQSFEDELNGLVKEAGERGT